jgi:hypothetical protein
MGPVNQAGEKAYFMCLPGVLGVPIRETAEGNPGGLRDCAQPVYRRAGRLGIDQVQTVLAKSAIELRTREPEAPRGS